MAASGVAVTVLTPNGRRQTVKVSPSTPLLQVLEDVCQKHGFNPDEHGLKFQRNLIDLTLPMRFANLPNNAKLEMVTSSRKQAVADSQVRIALQMEDGSRLQGSFSCGQSLFEVVTHFPQISESKLCESGSTPVCVYMRDEVSGLEALKTTTLKSLGLTGGSAIVRASYLDISMSENTDMAAVFRSNLSVISPVLMNNRAVKFLLKGNKAQEDDDSSEPTKTAAMPTTPVASEATASVPSQPDPAPSQPETLTSEMPVPNSSPQRPMDTDTVSPPTSATDALPGQQEVAPASQNAAQPKPPVAERERPEDDGETAGPSGQSTSPPAANAAPFIPFSGGGQRLGGPGGGAVGRSLSSSSSSSSLSALTAAVESPKAKKAKPSHTKCQSAANKPDVEMEEVEEFLEPIEREPLVYHLDSTSRHCEAYDNLPDEFFEVTVDDIRKRFAQLKSQREILEEAPLMTKSLREAQMKEKMERYPKVVLRVQFPDRHVLQGFFRPLETVGALRCFVKKHLEDPHLSFYLFITPPKTILSNPSTTLFQADLFPGALVYFGSDVKTDVYLKRELLESSVSAVQANESIASCILPPPTPSSSSVASSELQNPSELLHADAGGSVQDQQDPPTQAAKSSRSNPGKVPKWLKLPGKK